MLTVVKKYCSGWEVPRVERPPRWAVVLAVLLCGYGAVLRGALLTREDLYIDEVWRAAEIVEHSSIWGVKNAVQLSEFLFGRIGLTLFGQTELAFRVWPALFSTLALALFAASALRIFRPWPALFALALFSVNSGFVLHAQEFKPYSFELFLGQLAFFLAIPNLRKHPYALLLVLCVMMVGTNIGFFFLFLLPLLFFVFCERHSPLRALGLCLLPVIAFTAHYFAHFRRYLSLLKDAAVFQYWDEMYLTSARGVLRGVLYSPKLLLSDYLFPWINFEPLHPLFALFPLLLLALGMPLMLLRTKNLLALFVLFPLGAQLALSALGHYPWLSRVSTFFYPFLLFSLGLCLDAVLTRCTLTNCTLTNCTVKKLLPSPRLRTALASAALASLVLTLALTLNTRAPGSFTTKRSLNTVRAAAEPGDTIYLDYAANLGTRFYGALAPAHTEVIATTWGEGPEEVREFLVPVLQKQLLESLPSAPRKRVWIVAALADRSYEEIKGVLRSEGREILRDERTPHAFLILFR